MSKEDLTEKALLDCLDRIGFPVLSARPTHVITYGEPRKCTAEEMRNAIMFGKVVTRYGVSGYEYRGNLYVPIKGKS